MDYSANYRTHYSRKCNAASKKSGNSQLFDVFKLTVRYEKESVSLDSEKIGIAKMIKHAEKIVELIQVNPKITAAEMAMELSLSERHTRKIISRLVELRFIERKGSDKVGEWIIIKMTG